MIKSIERNLRTRTNLAVIGIGTSVGHIQNSLISRPKETPPVSIDFLSSSQSLHSLLKDPESTSIDALGIS